DTTDYVVTTTIYVCSSSDTVQVVVRPYPIPDAGADVGFCSGDTAQLGAASTGGYTYLWFPTTGISDSTISDPTVILANFSSIPDTTYYIVYTTVYGCSVSDSVRVIVYWLPETPEICGSMSVCPGVDSVSYWVNGTTGSTYQWMLAGDGIIVAGQGSDLILVNWGDTGTGTISVMETDSNLCPGDTSYINVETNVVLEPPVPGGNDTICSDYLSGIDYQVIYTNGSIYTWFITSGTITNGNGTNIITVDWDSVGTGMLWYEEESTTIDTVCTGVSDTLYISIFQSPTASVIEGSFIQCEDTASVQYSIAGLPGSYFTWLVDSDTIVSGIGLDTIYFVWDSAGVYELTVYETATGGCTEIFTDTVTVYQTPQTSAISGDTAICFDSIAEYLYYVSGLTGSLYQWDVTGGTITSSPITNDSITIRWDSIVVGNIMVIETSQDSCIGDTVSLTVNVYEVPVATAINGEFVLCEDIVPVSYWIPGLPGSFFTWFVDTIPVASGVGIDTISLVASNAGVYVLSVIETTINGCTQVLMDTVTVYETPQTSSINGDTAICYDSLAEYLYYVTGLPGSSYQWNVTGGTITSSPITNDSITIKWDSVVVGNIAVIETSQDSCIGDTVNLTVNVYEVPLATAINGGFVFCEDTVSNSYSIAGLPGSYFIWLINGNTIASGIDVANISIIWDTAGIYELMVIEVTPNTCSDTLSDTVIVYQTPQTSSIYGDTAICYEPLDEYLYFVAGLSGSSYQWDITGGFITSSPLTNDSITIQWDSLGVGYITVVEISQDSCMGDTISLTININEVPGATAINGEFEFCENTNSYSYFIDDLANSYFIWMINGDTIESGVDLDSISFIWDGDGIYELSVTETTVNGCIQVLTDTVIVNPLPVTSMIIGNLAVCPPDNFNQVYSVQGYDGSDFVWTVAGGEIVSGQGTDSIAVNWDTTGAASISVIETSEDSCIGETVYENIILDSPSIFLKVVSDGEEDDTEVEINWEIRNSIGLPQNVTISRRIHFSTDNWGSLNSIPAYDQIYIDESASTHDYSYDYRVTGKNACSVPMITAIHNTILLKGVHDENDNTIDIIWNHYNGWQNGVESYEVWRKLDNEVEYTYYENAHTDTIMDDISGNDGFLYCFRILADESGGGAEQSWSNEFCVEFKHLIKIPTAITPNGNGLNDTWEIGNMEFYPDCLVEIYNRWGLLVFSSRGYTEEWDGTHDGKTLPIGPYYYVIDLMIEDVKPYTGTVSIILDLE
ncbi:MAG: gliding motility-associated C-terminal domain-containing protein, partial [Bacteroidota bacterium]